MTITSDTWWSVECDRCGGKFPEGGDGNWQLAQSEKEAREMVTDYDGRFEDDGSITCLVCCEDEEPTDA